MPSTIVVNRTASCSTRASASRERSRARPTSARCRARATARRLRARPGGCRAAHAPGRRAARDLTGFRLCGIALGALLLALAERLLDFAHLGALQVPDLERERLDRRTERRARVHHLGVAVAGEHLRRRHRTQPEVLAHVLLDERIDVRVRADRARQLADRDRPRAPAAAARDRGAPASPTARASRRTSSARRGCRACGRPSACRGTRGPARAIAAFERRGRGDDRGRAHASSASASAVSTTSLDVRP